MSRWKAAGIHFSISVCVAIGVLVLLFGVWYPPPYFQAAGGGKLEMILVGVDLTLGPLLTLIVFKAGKKGMKFDLAVIGIVQAVALVYGMSVILSTRPVFLVASIDRFVLVSADKISDTDLEQGPKPDFRSLSWSGPRLVAVKMPTDAAQKNDLFESEKRGKDVERLPQYYVDYVSQAPALLARAKPLAQLESKHPRAKKKLDKWLSKHDQVSADVVWLPVTTRFDDVTMLLDKRTGQPLDAIAINPW